MARKVILDVDTGIDDALALMLALRSPEIEVLAVTCVAGNITIDHVVRNTLATLELAGHDVPVAIGARKPLMAPLRTATYFHGKNGVADILLPEARTRPVEEDAASLMVRLAREHPGQITLIPVGPLTNVALAVLRDAAFAGNLAEMVIMGGALSHPGNATGAAEANFSNDPEAAAAVAAAGASIRLVDLGATTQVVLRPERIQRRSEEPPSSIGAFAAGLLEFYIRACVSAGAEGAILHDPLAVGLAALPELATYVPLHLEIETGGTFARGACIGNFSGLAPILEPAGDHRDAVGLAAVPPNAAVARNVAADRFIELFLERLELTA